MINRAAKNRRKPQNEPFVEPQNKPQTEPQNNRLKTVRSTEQKTETE